MITLSNVPAYSFGKAKKKTKNEVHTPGPGQYNWHIAKMSTLKKYPNSTIPRSKLERGNYLRE